jgi:hypothetical protein
MLEKSYYSLVWIGLWFRNSPSIAKVIGAGPEIYVNITMIGFRAGSLSETQPGPNTDQPGLAIVTSSRRGMLVVGM